MNPKQITIILFSFLLLSYAGFGQKIEFSNVCVFLPEKKNVQLQKAVQVLREVINERTNILLPLLDKAMPAGKQIIAVGVEGRMDKFPEYCKTAVMKLPETGKEGYKIILIENSTVIIAGHDERGAMYGIGWLLRKMEMMNGMVKFYLHGLAVRMMVAKANVVPRLPKSGS